MVYLMKKYIFLLLIIVNITLQYCVSNDYVILQQFEGDIESDLSRKPLFDDFSGNKETIDQRFAIVIGINDYLSKEIENLKYAENDASRMKDVLEDYGVFTVKYFSDKYISKDGKEDKQVGESPLKKNIEKTIDDIISIYEQNKNNKGKEVKTIVFFFSGHGFRINDNNYIATKEMDLKNPEETGININNLLDKFSIMKESVKIMFFIDACRKEPVGMKGGDESDSDSSFIWSDYEAKGLTILYSTEPNHYSYESDMVKHGLYTYYLVEALKGEASRRVGNTKYSVTTFDNASDYVIKKLTEWSANSKMLIQKPVKVISDDVAGEFIITRSKYRSPRPDYSPVYLQLGGGTFTNFENILGIGELSIMFRLSRAITLGIELNAPLLMISPLIKFTFLDTGIGFKNLPLTHELSIGIGGLINVYPEFGLGLSTTFEYLMRFNRFGFYFYIEPWFVYNWGDMIVKPFLFYFEFGIGFVINF